MKAFNPKYETVIHFTANPKVEKPKEGEVVPHKVSVDYCHTFFLIPDASGKEVFVKAEMTREMVLQLAEQITKMESEEINIPFDSLSDLPF